MEKPNLILLGAQKAGTTSLYSWIAQHPDVFGSLSIKDLPIFIDEKNRSLGLDEFKEYILKNRKKEKYVFHGWVHYISFFKEFLAAFQNDISNSKYIIILRDPVERMISNFKYSLSHYKEEKSSIIDAIRHEQENRNSFNFEKKSYCSYIRNSLYADDIAYIQNNVEKENLLILWFEDLAKTPQETVNNAFNFLGLRPYDINFIKQNETRELKHRKMFRLLKLIIKLIPFKLKQIVPFTIRHNIRNQIHKLFSSKIPKQQILSHKDKVMLYKKHFKEDTDKLIEMGLNPYWSKKYYWD